MPCCILKHNFNHHCFRYKKKKPIESSSNGKQASQDNNDSLRGKWNKEIHKYSQLKGAAALSPSTLVSLSPWAWWPHLYPVPGQARIEYISLSFSSQFSVSAHQYVHAHTVFIWVPILDHIFKKERESGKNREKKKIHKDWWVACPSMSCLPSLC